MITSEVDLKMRRQDGLRLDGSPEDEPVLAREERPALGDLPLDFEASRMDREVPCHRVVGLESEPIGGDEAIGIAEERYPLLFADPLL